MFLKSFSLSLVLFSLLLTSSFADTVQVRTNEPESKYLGMKIDLKGRDFVDRFPVAPEKFVVINKNLTDVRIKQDKVNHLNKFYALVPYAIHIKGATPSDLKFLYVQCPITRETYVDRSPPPREEMVNGKLQTVLHTDYEVLSKKILDSGSYSFLSSPDYQVSQLSEYFPMVGTVDQLIFIEAMCLNIEVAHAEYKWAETFRRVMLGKFGISE